MLAQKEATKAGNIEKQAERSALGIFSLPARSREAACFSGLRLSFDDFCAVNVIVRRFRRSHFGH